MIKFYFNPSPNPFKVALLLEETGLSYEVVPIDVHKGEQLSPAFLAINPNGKVPVIVDDGVRVFDSNAILLYLAEKTGQFLPPGGPAARAEMLSWLMFVATGIGPYSGQAVHFRHYAPKGLDYADKRYQFEARRHYEILNEQLGSKTHLLGEHYTIVDMAAWGWACRIPLVIGDDAWDSLPNLKRWFDHVSARPAAVRVNTLANKFTFKTETEDERRRYMFRHTAVP